MENRLPVVTDVDVVGGTIKREHEEDLCHDVILLYLDCGGGYMVLHMSYCDKE